MNAVEVTARENRERYNEKMSVYFKFKPDFKDCRKFKIEDPWGWYFIQVRTGLRYFWKEVYKALSLYGNQFSYISFMDGKFKELQKEHKEVGLLPYHMTDWFFDQIEHRYWKEFYTGVKSKNFCKEKKLGYISFGEGTIEKHKKTYVIKGVLPFEMEMKLRCVKHKDDLKVGYRYKFTKMFMCHTKYRITKHEVLDILDYDPDDLILYIKICKTEPVRIEGEAED